jgi:hypothetical protein
MNGAAVAADRALIQMRNRTNDMLYSAEFRKEVLEVPFRFSWHGHSGR